MQYYTKNCNMQNFFEFFLKKTLFQNHFPIFCNNIIQLRHSLKTGGWRRNPCRIRSRQNRREAVFSVPGLSFALTFHLRMRWKLRKRDSSSCADWKNRRRRGLGDESGRECNALIFRHINRMLKREALQEDKQALLGFQTGVSWGVSRPWLEGK